MSKVYINLSQIVDINIKHNNNFIFRKFLDNGEAGKNEYKIAKTIYNYPFKSKNIVNFYDVNEKYIDMEILETEIMLDRSVRYILRKLKDFLQNIGIAYIDWHEGNIGIDKEGNIKLFDFDCSGIFDTKTNEWIEKPPIFYNYKNAVENGMKTPKDIDNYCFDKFICFLK